MKRIVIGILLSILFLPLYSTTLMEEQVALEPLSTPQVRYWKPAIPDTLAVQTLTSLESPKQLPVRRNPKLIVLLYHNIVFGRTGNIYNRDLYNFEHDLAFLVRNVKLTNFPDFLGQSSNLNTDHAIITFDDGDLSLYAIVYPLFRQYELEATIFLVPNFIGQVGYMSWEQVREMSNYRTSQGKKLFHIESHSLTHRMMGSLSEEEIFHELKESKRIIEQRTEHEVSVLALPFGHVAGDERIIKAAKELGYIAIRTSIEQALPLHQVNPWMIGSLNVENYSTDVMASKVRSLLGR